MEDELEEKRIKAIEAELRRLRVENRYALMGVLPILTDDEVHAITDLLRTMRGDSL